MTRPLVLTAVLMAACVPDAEPHLPLQVTCDASAPAGVTALNMRLTPEAAAVEGRVLLRVDSLTAEEGPIHRSGSGFLVQVFGKAGPGYGCATTEPVGAWIWGPGEALARSWIHVKSDLPVVLTVWSADDDIVAEARGEPGVPARPIEWEGQ